MRGMEARSDFVNNLCNCVEFVFSGARPRSFFCHELHKIRGLHKLY